ncbi:putative 26S proteasome regulatory subunit, partial [Pseudocyphellaria aurata]|nr:putative 26S proteasome regulatory subunit [Pseudocyphellaria aurata]
MGLNMDNIHNPSVPSGPTTSQGTSKAVDQGTGSLMDLISQKERVEAELSALSGVLDSHGVKMNTTLTTFDGYPRDDIDVAQIRTTRARIIRLRNDYKTLMSRIEDGLHAHHASLKASDHLLPSSSSQGPTANRAGNSQDLDGIEPSFARIGGVATGSPAEDAGLRVGDQITKFGDVNWMNHEKLSKVAETVQRSEGVSIVLRYYFKTMSVTGFWEQQVIRVMVLRQDSGSSEAESLQFQLTPRRNWGGR